MKAIETERAQDGKTRTPQSDGEQTLGTQTLLEQVPVVRVAIDSLVITDSPRISGENTEHIQALANVQGKLPPITVHRASMQVLDGMHRLRAAQSRGHHEIEVQFFDGNDADAFVVAVKSNITHGLPLSLADRKAAATRIIASHPQWSDRRIASVSGLAARTIAEMRRKPDGQTSSAEIRIGRDDRARPTNSAERRTIATKLLANNPTLSLRHIARIAGISPETARDVRSQHHIQQNPTQPRQNSRARTDPRHKKPQDHRDHALGDSKQIMRQLRSDPTLLGTEAGRVLLRLLAIHGISNEKWLELHNSIPAHHKNAIANLAMECARTWKKFSERLTTHGEPRETTPTLRPGDPPPEL